MTLLDLQPQISLGSNLVQGGSKTEDIDDEELDDDPDDELQWSGATKQKALDLLLDFDHDLSEEVEPPPVSLFIV